MPAITALESALRSYLQSRAMTAWRMAPDDRKAAFAHLEAMAGQDVLLAEAIRQAGFHAALKAGRGDFNKLVRTAGVYRATHPDEPPGE